MEKKISVVIPNYNGSRLLKKNLPAVIKNSPNCQIIVVDDASTDNSVEFIQNNFKSVKLVQLAENKGFAFAANEGVRNAHGDYVLLLNSDVAPRPNFLQPALAHFRDDKIFGVGLGDYSHEDKRIVVRGKGGASFQKGFVRHFMLGAKSGKTLWVSGGSGLFDKRKFLELGGFDTNFTPFYWEDIDLSFRAWKMGYVCMFEPKSKVDHFHQEGAIQKSNTEFFVKTVSYKNQFIFVWKNISNSFWLFQHILWFPYHTAKTVVTFDFAFIIGFLWALTKIPGLIFEWKMENGKWKLSDREVLSKFAKP